MTRDIYTLGSHLVSLIGDVVTFHLREQYRCGATFLDRSYYIGVEFRVKVATPGNPDCDRIVHRGIVIRVAAGA